MMFLPDRLDLPLNRFQVKGGGVLHRRECNRRLGELRDRLLRPDEPPGFAAEELVSVTASVRRRMRAVTGSSADECFCRTRCGVASMLFAALSVFIFSASSETLGPSSLSG